MPLGILSTINRSTIARVNIAGGGLSPSQPIVSINLLGYYNFNTTYNALPSPGNNTAPSISSGSASISTTTYNFGGGSLYQTNAAYNVLYLGGYSLTTANKISIAYWFYPVRSTLSGNVGDYNISATSGGTTANYYNLVQNTNSNPTNNTRFGPFISGGAGKLVYMNGDSWHHIAIIYNNNVCTYYIDNSLCDTFTGNTPPTMTTAYIILGSNGSSSGSTQRGSMYHDDFRIYDGLLTATDVANIYNFSPNYSDVPGYSLYYKFDNTSGGYVYNYANGTYDLQLVNSASVITLKGKNVLYLNNSAFKTSGTAPCAVLSSTVRNSIFSTSNSLSSITISFWAYCNSARGSMILNYAASGGASGNSGNVIFVGLGSTASIIKINTSIGDTNCSVPIATTSGFVHICIIINNGTGFSFYFNGSLNTTKTTSTNIINQNIGTFTIGSYYPYSPYTDSGWYGYISQYRLYNFALTPTQIVALYNYGY